MSLWFMNLISSNAGERCVFATSELGDPYDIELIAGTNDVKCYSPSAFWNDANVNVPAISNQWQQLTAVGTGVVVKIYLNGVWSGTANCTSGGRLPADSIRSVGIWCDNTGPYYSRQLAQNLDEARIENGERSSNWVYAVWLNIASNSFFNSFAAVTGSNGVSISDFPFIEQFETNTCVVGDLTSQHNWNVSAANSAMVETNVVYAGTNAAGLKNVTISQVFTNSGDVNATNMWVDLYCMTPRRTTAGAPAPSNNTAAAFYIDTNGYVVVYSNSTWITNTTFVAPTNGWTELTANLDYIAKTWTLYAASNTGNGTIMLATNLHFGVNAGNNNLGCFRIVAQNNQTTGYVDNISIQSNAQSSSYSTWQLWQLQYLGSMTNSANSASAANGWTLYQQFVAGVNPTNPTSYLKILSCDITASNSNDIAVQIFGGACTISSTYGAGNFSRSFTILAANNSSTNTKVAVGTSVADNLSGTNTWTDPGQPAFIPAASTMSPAHTRA